MSIDNKLGILSRIRSKLFLRSLCFVLLLVCETGSANSITLAFSLENYDFKGVVEQFEAESGIRVNIAKIESSDMKVELLSRAEQGSLPDAVIIPADMLGLEDVNFSTISTTWLSEELAENLKPMSYVEGEIKGVPLIAGNHLLLYFNRELISKPAETWEQLTLQRSSLPPGVGLISWNYNEMYWLQPFLGAFGAKPVTMDGLHFDTRELQRAFVFYKELATRQWLNEKCDYQCAFDNFVSGKSAYTINGTWSFGGFKKVMGESLGLVVLPTIQGRKMRPYTSVHALAFPNQSLNSEHSEALKKLAMFLQRRAVQKIIWEELSGLPTNRFVLQQVRSSADDNVQNLILQLQDAIAMPNSLEMAIAWETLLMGFSRYQGGAMSVEETTAYMQYIADKTRAEIK